MKLKKLIVIGFKSFADRTEFEFDDGVSCIVGPNGCGKSNVVDAVKWVLGEQSAKSLRGSEMMDVIFNGSSVRKPSGAATVTLVFDNSDGLLQPAGIVGSEAAAAGEVSVTRRLYRSGQSEYLINNNPARLKDIKEMFLDTGLGASNYSIIEQGRISQFLQASQDERRAFFDEAAGISRYKSKRKETLRKLDRVEQNLLRLTDILAEVEKQLRSIKYQAGKARNYQAYTERFKELRSLYFLSRYHTLTEQRKTCQGELDTAGDRLSAIQARIGQLEAAQFAAEVEGVELEQTARDLGSRVATISSQITTLQERAEMQASRAEELTRQILENTSRSEELEAKIDDCAKDLATREAQLQSVFKDIEELHARSEAVRREYADGGLAITQLQGQIDDEKSGLVDLLRRTTQLHNDAHAIGLRRVGLHGERMRIECRIEEIARDLEALLIERAQFQAKRDDVEGVLADSKKKLNEVNVSADELLVSEQKLAESLADSREKRSRLAGRAHTLEEMQRRMEGVAEGPRRVLQAVEEGKLKSIRGMLGDFIETEMQHAPLVEAALAGADQYLLAAHHGEVHDEAGCMEEILGAGGSVEVICMDRLDRPTEPPKADVSMICPQSLACVRDWVRFDSWLEPTMWSLLGHTLVVRTLDDAASAAAVTPPGYRFVTLKGEVLEADGRIRLGSASHTAGFIGRKSELTDLKQREAALTAEIENLQNECTHTHDQREHLDKIIQSLRTAIYEANFERGECDRQLTLLDERITRCKNDQPLLNQNLRTIREEIDSVVRNEHETREKAVELEQMRIERDGHLDRLEAELAAAREQMAELTEKRNDMRVAVASAEQKKISLSDAAGVLRRQREEMDAEFAAAKNNIELDRERKARAESEIEKSRAEVERLYADQQMLQVEAQETEESRKGLVERLGEIRQRLTEKRHAAEEAGQAIGNLRVKLSELDAHVGDLISRASDEMQMDIAELYTNYEHDEERNWDEVEAEINDLRGKIDRLGTVNLDAISQQEELQQRREYLSGQFEDIRQAQKQLEDLIRKINKESRERFIETFTAVRENFQTIFRKLFGGGKADIILTDPADVLESGIDVVARPPGKELRSISLLSGGEKTMAALAMIFSFFKAKPSPFCLLDEVDAALDEANTERYNALVTEFLEDTQFIMISHAKRTMAMASVLYGVTMQERGVSKRISVRFEQADRLNEVLEPVAP